MSKRYYLVNRDISVTEKQIRNFVEEFFEGDKEEKNYGYSDVTIKSLKVDREKGEQGLIEVVVWGREKWGKKEVREHKTDLNLDEVIRFIHRLQGEYFGCISIGRL